jgi:mannose-6-phosphate isomerase-like protein (cupin superfamily)
VTSVRVLKRDELPLTDIARELVGADHGGLGVCLIFVDAAPGEGPALHRHPYEEVFVTIEGEATVVAGDEEIRVGAGDVVIVPADTAHAFTNSGAGRLRQIDIHLSPSFSTEWL